MAPGKATQRVRTSDVLQQGEIYTRQQLRDFFGIVDKTIDTGILKRDHDSVWLSVTETKHEGITSYVDRLDGDVLYWQGQAAGSKDRLIVEHRERGFELAIFYRPRIDAYPDFSLKFEGTFIYESHSGGSPQILYCTVSKRPTRWKQDLRWSNQSRPNTRSCASSMYSGAYASLGAIRL